MVGKHLQAIALFLVAAGSVSPVRAQDAAGAIGTYCLVGVREVGSCIRLAAGGKFEYFLAYGAYDESSEGTWKLANGEIIVDSLAYDRQPTFAFKQLRRGVGDGFDVIVEWKSGGSIAGIDVSVTCDGRTKHAGVTQAEGFKVDCASAPTAAILGLRMYGLAPQTIEVANHSGADKVYVFEFDPGDLGRKKFVAHRLRFKTDDALVMVYTASPITELNGRSFEYVRSR